MVCFGDQAEVSDDGEIDINACRKVVFDTFAGVIKLILEEHQNQHVLRCL